MHFHICPQEIALMFLIWEQVQAYTFHIRHIVFSFFTEWRNKNCKICNKINQTNNNMEVINMKHRSMKDILLELKPVGVIALVIIGFAVVCYIAAVSVA